MSSGRERLRVAHALGDLPKISEKFSKGAISYSKVRAITRVAEFANDQYLKREVTYHYDHDGCLVMKARIPADQSELIVKALEMAIEENHVTAETPTAKWYAGEQMDWEHAVSLMFTECSAKSQQR